MTDALAFPTCIQVDTVSETKGGLTKRELLSAIILSGMATRSYLDDETIERSIMYTDKLLKQLEQTGEEDGPRKT